MKKLLLLAAVLAAGVAWADEEYDSATIFAMMSTRYVPANNIYAYFDAGYVPNGKTVIRAKYTLQCQDSQCLFCARYKANDRGETKPDFTFFPMVTGTGGRFDYYDQAYSSSMLAQNYIGIPLELEVKDGKAKLTVSSSGAEVASFGRTGGAAAFDGAYPLYLLSTYSPTGNPPSGWQNMFRGDFYYLRIYEIEDGKEVLKREFLPCRLGVSPALAETVSQTVVRLQGNADPATIELSGEEEGGSTLFDSAVFFKKMRVIQPPNYARIGADYKPNGKTIIRAKYAVGSGLQSERSTSSTYCLFCARESSSTPTADKPTFTYFATVSKGAPRFDYYSSNKPATSPARAGAVYELEITNGVATVFDVEKGTFEAIEFESSDFTGKYPLYLFATYSPAGSPPTGWGNGFKGDFYYLRIYEIEDGKEVLKREFLPCRVNGIPAVAETVSKRILYSEDGTIEAFRLDSADRADGVNEYREAEFFSKLSVHSNPQAGTRINADYKPNGGTIIRAGYTYRSGDGSGQCLFCARKDVNTRDPTAPMFAYFPSVSGSVDFMYYNSEYKSSGQFPGESIVELEVRDGLASLSNVTSGATMTIGREEGAAAFDGQYPMYLFSSYSSQGEPPSAWNNCFQGDFHYLRIYEIADGKEVLKHEYLPCRYQKAVGLADTVTKTISYNLTGVLGELVVNEADKVRHPDRRWGLMMIIR